MYPGKHAVERADQAASIMAATGLTVTCANFEARANLLAHLLRDLGLARLDHCAIFMGNNEHYFEACAAGERSSLYCTCVNSYLTAPELAYIINNSEPKVLITSRALLPVACEAAAECPNLIVCHVAGAVGDDQFLDYHDAVSSFPSTPIDDECLGTAMLYSSGTTGRPKGILRPPPDLAPGTGLAIMHFLTDIWGIATAPSS